MLVGIFNLVAVQMEKIRTAQKKGIYGVFLFLSLIITFFLGLLVGPENQYMRLAVDAIIVPVEAALMAILASHVDLCQHSSISPPRGYDDRDLFTDSLALSRLPLCRRHSVRSRAARFILDITGMFSRGGARGLLIGVALGTLLTGLACIVRY